MPEPVKRKVKFIINPFSGTRPYQEVERLIEETIDRQLFESDHVFTLFAGHAIQLAAEAAAAGYDIVVAVGGDGSVNEVATGLMGTQTALGILPAGSGNGFAMHLGWGRDLKKAVQLLGAAVPIPVDMCTFNGRPFVNLAGTGFDAEVAAQLHGQKKRGFRLYFTISVKTYLRYQCGRYRIRLDGRELDREAFSITVANAPMYGYNFNVAPRAKYNDGLLEVVIIRKAPWWQYLRNMHRFLNQTLQDSSIVESFQAHQVEIIPYESAYAHLDGEGMVAPDRMLFGILPGVLQVMVPGMNR